MLEHGDRIREFAQGDNSMRKISNAIWTLARSPERCEISAQAITTASTWMALRMNDTYAINVAKSHYREGFNTGDVERVLSAFASEFTDMSDGRPNRYGADAATKLRGYLSALFARYHAKLNVIIIAIDVLGNTAYDYGWHELTLTPRDGGEAIHRRTRYLELWSKQVDGDWRIANYMDNTDLPDTL